MTEFKLNKVDPEDIEDILAKVESSFDIKFDDKELLHITTFGQLFDPYFRQNSAQYFK